MCYHSKTVFFIGDYKIYFCAIQELLLMKQYLRKKFEELLLKEKSIHVLAASFCMGTFIALTPTIPLQTWLLLGLAWPLRLNIAVAMAALYLVNNPLTMIPIYVIGYALGMWLSRLVGIDLLRYNPWWVERFNEFLSSYVDISTYLGTDICFWCLIIGGTLFALMVSIPLYPLLIRMLTHLAAELEKRKLYEDYNN